MFSLLLQGILSTSLWRSFCSACHRTAFTFRHVSRFSVSNSCCRMNTIAQLLLRLILSLSFPSLKDFLPLPSQDNSYQFRHLWKGISFRSSQPAVLTRLTQIIMVILQRHILPHNALRRALQQPFMFLSSLSCFNAFLSGMSNLNSFNHCVGHSVQFLRCSMDCTIFSIFITQEQYVGWFLELGMNHCLIPLLVSGQALGRI